MSCDNCRGTQGDSGNAVAICGECGKLAGRDIPLITGRDLEHAPPGLYVMQAAPGVPYTSASDMVYDLQTDAWTEGPHVLILMARVRDADGRPLPKGQFDAYLRSDGRQVIKSYQTPPQD